MIQKSKEGKHAREPPTKFKGRTVRSLIEKDSNVQERYEIESKEEGTNLKISMTSEKTNTKDEGVTEKPKRLKGELLVELKTKLEPI